MRKFLGEMCRLVQEFGKVGVSNCQGYVGNQKGCQGSISRVREQVLRWDGIIGYHFHKKRVATTVEYMAPPRIEDTKLGYRYMSVSIPVDTKMMPYAALPSSCDLQKVAFPREFPSTDTIAPCQPFSLAKRMCVSPRHLFMLYLC